MGRISSLLLAATLPELLGAELAGGRLSAPVGPVGGGNRENRNWGAPAAGTHSSRTFLALPAGVLDLLRFLGFRFLVWIPSFRMARGRGT